MMQSQLLLAIKNQSENQNALDNIIEETLFKCARSHGVLWQQPVDYSQFDAIVHRLEHFKRHDLLDLMVVITIESGDLIGLKSLEQARYLVLAFPEVYWVFMFDVENVADIPAEVRRYHWCQYRSAENYQLDSEVKTCLDQAIARHSSGFRTLFDPTGLRLWIRKDESPVIKRAAVVEDEVDYGYFNAYFMYMRGLNVYLIQTVEENVAFYQRLTGDSEFKLDYCIEDMELNFADLEKGQDKRFRLQHFDELLKENNQRIISKAETGIIISVTAGEHERFKIIIKPYAGMYDEQLDGLIKRREASELRRTHDVSRHGIPGLEQKVATALVESCRQMINSEGPGAYGTRYAIHAAVLANEARILLGNNTRMLNLATIELKQQAELIAESNFVGISTKDVLDTRLGALDEEVIRLWPNNDNSQSTTEQLAQQRQIGLSKIKIYEMMNRIFVHYGKFEEIKLVSKKVSTCFLQLKYPSTKRDAARLKLFGYFLNAATDGNQLIKYAMGWILFFFNIYLYTDIVTCLFDPTITLNCINSLFHAALGSVSLFFTLALPAGIEHQSDSWLMWVNWVNATVGAVHIGLGIAFLFSVLNRK